MRGTRVYSVRIPSSQSNDDAERLMSASPLSAYRMDKVRRLRFPGDRMRSIASELLLMRALEDNGAKAQLPLTFSSGASGKPRLKSLPSVEFNISHSGDYVVCALGDNPVGIDVERIVDSDIQTLFNDVCTKAEQEILEGIPSTERIERFFMLWTAKEAIAKAMGLGLSLSFPSIGLDVLALSLGIPVLAAQTLTPGGFCLYFHDIAPDYACCSASYPCSPLVGLKTYPWTELLV